MGRPGASAGRPGLLTSEYPAGAALIDPLRRGAVPPAPAPRRAWGAEAA